MHCMKRIILVIALLLQADHAFSDGNSLLRSCKATIRIADGAGGPEHMLDSVKCTRLLEGMRSMNDIYATILPKEQLFYCVPQKVTTFQLSRVVADYLEKNPNELHEHEAYLVGMALIEAFPCE